MDLGIVTKIVVTLKPFTHSRTYLSSAIWESLSSSFLNQGWPRASLADILFLGSFSSICIRRSRPSSVMLLIPSIVSLKSKVLMTF